MFSLMVYFLCITFQIKMKLKKIKNNKKKQTKEILIMNLVCDSCQPFAASSYLWVS